MLLHLITSVKARGSSDIPVVLSEDSDSDYSTHGTYKLRNDTKSVVQFSQ